MRQPFTEEERPEPEPWPALRRLWGRTMADLIRDGEDVPGAARTGRRLDLGCRFCPGFIVIGPPRSCGDLACVDFHPRARHLYTCPMTRLHLRRRDWHKN